MNVFVARPIPARGLEKLRAAHTVDVFESDMPPTRAELIARIKGVDGIVALVTDRIDGEVLDAAGPQLKCVSNMAVGYDNVDANAAKARGVWVTNTPGVLTETSADLAWSLLMAAARRIPEGVDYAKRGDWKTFNVTLFLGQDIYGATLGIAGFGRIGQAVARRARGFGMRILYSQRNRDLQAEAELGATFVDKDTLLKQSDFVSLNMSMNASSKGYIGAREIALMKPNAVLVNTARGPVVDTQALYEAMAAKRIFAAALDVTDPEPLPHTHPLYALSNVLIVPHIASASVETRSKMSDIACSNMLAALAGETPPNLVAEFLK